MTGWDRQSGCVELERPARRYVVGMQTLRQVRRGDGVRERHLGSVGWLAGFALTAKWMLRGVLFGSFVGVAGGWLVLLRHVCRWLIKRSDGSCL